jgi:hypothetical protein
MSKTVLCHAVSLLVFDTNIENYVDIWNLVGPWYLGGGRLP